MRKEALDREFGIQGIRYRIQKETFARAYREPFYANNTPSNRSNMPAILGDKPSQRLRRRSRPRCRSYCPAESLCLKRSSQNHSSSVLHSTAYDLLFVLVLQCARMVVISNILSLSMQLSKPLQSFFLPGLRSMERPANFLSFLFILMSKRFLLQKMLLNLLE